MFTTQQLDATGKTSLHIIHRRKHLSTRSGEYHENDRDAAFERLAAGPGELRQTHPSTAYLPRLVSFTSVDRLELVTVEDWTNLSPRYIDHN